MNTELFHFICAVLCIILAASGFALHATAFGAVWLLLAALQCWAFFAVAKAEES